MNTVRHSLLALAASLLCASPAWALKFEEPRVLSSTGQRVAIDIPFHLNAGEQVLSVGIAPPSVYSSIGVAFPASLRTGTATLQSNDGQHLIHIAGAVPNGNRFTLVLNLTTGDGAIGRQFEINIPPKPVAPVAGIEPLPLERRNPDAPRVFPVAAKSLPLTVGGQDAVFDKRLSGIEVAVGRVADGIKEVAAVVKQDSAEREKQLALTALTVEASQRSVSDLVEWGGIGAVFGFGMGGLWFLGSGSRVSIRRPVELVGIEGRVIQGEFVRITSANEPKGFAYRLADLLSGAPKRVEFRATGVPASPLQRQESTFYQRRATAAGAEPGGAIDKPTLVPLHGAGA